MDQQNRTFAVFWKIFFSLCLLAAVTWFVVRTSSVIGCFLTAGALAFILNPAVEALTRKRVPRGLAIMLLFVAFFGLIAIGVIFLGPILYREVTSFLGDVPEYTKKLRALWGDFNGFLIKSNVPFDLSKLPDTFSQQAGSISGKAGKSFFNGLSGFFSAMSNLILIPILMYYFLKDATGVRRAFLTLVPREHRSEADTVIGKISTSLSDFVRGQLKLCLAMFLLTWLTMQFIVQLPNALVFGLIAGVTEFIPYLGPILALIGPLFFAMTISWTKVIVVLITFVILQLIEGNLLAPKIIGNDVDIHPAVLMFALMAGGQVGGIAGMIVAIPVAVIVKTLFTHFYLDRMENR